MTPLSLLATLTVAAYWYARSRAQRSEIAALRKRTAGLLRRVRRERDAQRESYEAAVEVAKEEMAKNEALTEELRAFWDEEQRLERVSRVIREKVFS